MVDGFVDGWSVQNQVVQLRRCGYKVGTGWVLFGEWLRTDSDTLGEAGAVILWGRNGFLR